MDSDKFDISFKFTYVQGRNNEIADMLSRWQNSQVNVQKLRNLAPGVVWLNVENNFQIMKFNLFLIFHLVIWSIHWQTRFKADCKVLLPYNPIVLPLYV